MWQVVLIAALLGALVSGGLSFFVRRALDARAQGEVERKLAYVVLVRVSNLIAFDMAARQAVKEKFASMKVAPGADIALCMSASFAEVLKMPIAAQIATQPRFRTLSRVVRRILEDAKDSRFSLEQLAKLPRPAVVAMMEYQNAYSAVCDAAALWADFFEHGEQVWATPEHLHMQWRSIERFIDRAYNARRTLIEYGAATLSEADALLKSQREQLDVVAAAYWTDHSKLAPAKTAPPTPASPERS